MTRRGPGITGAIHALPKWAQNRIDGLELQLAHLKKSYAEEFARLAAPSLVAHSRIGIYDGLDVWRRLPEDTRIAFRPVSHAPQQDELVVRLDIHAHPGGIEVQSRDRAMFVSPGSHMLRIWTAAA